MRPAVAYMFELRRGGDRWSGKEGRTRQKDL
jgi:hypothetical protein